MVNNFPSPVEHILHFTVHKISGLLQIVVAVSGRGSNLWFTVRDACFFGDPQLVLQIEAKRKGWGGLFRGTQMNNHRFQRSPKKDTHTPSGECA